MARTFYFSAMKHIGLSSPIGTKNRRIFTALERCKSFMRVYERPTQPNRPPPNETADAEGSVDTELQRVIPRMGTKKESRIQMRSFQSRARCLFRLGACTDTGVRMLKAFYIPPVHTSADSARLQTRGALASMAPQHHNTARDFTRERCFLHRKTKKYHLSGSDFLECFRKQPLKTLFLLQLPRRGYAPVRSRNPRWRG